MKPSRTAAEGRTAEWPVTRSRRHQPENYLLLENQLESDKHNDSNRTPLRPGGPEAKS